MSAHQDLGLTAREPRARNDLGHVDACGCGHAGGGCACGRRGTDATHGTSRAAATSVVTELSVTGMTCSHCVQSVTEELAEIYGVNGVDVTLHPEGVSTVVVLSEAPLDRAHVAAAIEEAGYALVNSPLYAD